MLNKEKELHILTFNQNKDITPDTVIPIEKINGPVLLISSKHDAVWESYKSSVIMEKRLSETSFPYSHKHKKAAFRETYRVLKKGGSFIACFYIKGESKITDSLVRYFLAKKGWFTPPFDTADKLKKRLQKAYDLTYFNVEGSMVYFCAVKR